MAPEHRYSLDMSNHALGASLSFICDQLSDLIREAGNLLVGATCEEARAVFNGAIDHFDKLEDDLCRLNHLLCEQKLVSRHVEGPDVWIERVLDGDSTHFVPSFYRASVGARPKHDQGVVDLSQAYNMLHVRAQNLFRGMIYPDEDPRMYKELAQQLEAQQEKQRLRAEDVQRQAEEAFRREQEAREAAEPSPSALSDAVNAYKEAEFARSKAGKRLAKQEARELAEKQAQEQQAQDAAADGAARTEAYQDSWRKEYDLDAPLRTK